jgi:hypothetical protein
MRRMFLSESLESSETGSPRRPVPPGGSPEPINRAITQPLVVPVPSGGLVQPTGMYYFLVAVERKQFHWISQLSSMNLLDLVLSGKNFEFNISKHFFSTPPWYEVIINTCNLQEAGMEASPDSESLYRFGRLIRSVRGLATQLRVD